MAEEDGLSHEGEAGVAEAVTGLDGGWGELVRVGEMEAEPEGLVSAEDTEEGCGDAHREGGWDFGTDADEADVWDGAEGGEEAEEEGVWEEEGVAAGEEDVMDFGVVLDPVEGWGEVCGGGLGLWGAVGAGAVAADGGAVTGDEEEDFMGVGADEAGGDGVCVFAEGVGEFARMGLGFAGVWEVGAAEGVGGGEGGEEGEGIGGEGEGHTPGGGLFEGAAFGWGEGEEWGKGGEVSEAVAELPAPVIPAFFGGMWGWAWGVHGWEGRKRR